MRTKKLFAIILALLMCIALFAGCSDGTINDVDESRDVDAERENLKQEIDAGGNVNDVEDYENYDYSAHVNSDGKTVIRAATSMDPTTFDSTTNANNAQSQVMGYMRQSLLFQDRATGEILPRLAKSYELDEDNVTYHFEIFENITDSDGNPFTSSDVKYSLETLKAAGINNTANIVEVNVIDDTHVDIVFDRDLAYACETCLTSLNLFTEKAYEDANRDFSTRPVYTGRYVLTEYVPGSKIVLEAREDYWQTDETQICKMDRGNVDIIEFYIIPDSAQVSIALETGQVDMICGLSYTDAQTFINSDEFKTFTYANPFIQCMMLNMNPDSIFCNNPKLREAVMYCVDVQGMIDAACDGLGEAMPLWGDTGAGDYTEDWNNGNGYYTYDIDYALECMEEANVDMSNISIRIMTNGDEIRNKYALVLMANLEEIGIKSEILSYNDALFNTYKNDYTQWDIILDNMGFQFITSQTRQKFLPASFAEGQPNAIFWHDEEVAELAERIISNATGGPEVVAELERYLFDNNVVRGLFKQTIIAATSDCVVEFTTNGTTYLNPAGSTYVWNIR